MFGQSFSFPRRQKVHQSLYKDRANFFHDQEEICWLTSRALAFGADILQETRLQSCQFDELFGKILLKMMMYFRPDLSRLDNIDLKKLAKEFVLRKPRRENIFQIPKL